MGVTAMGIMATPTDTTTVASDQLTPLLTQSLLLTLILLQTPMLSLMEFTVMVIAVATTLTVVTMVTVMGIMAIPTDTAVGNLPYLSHLITMVIPTNITVMAIVAIVNK